ncbi:MAG: hypothetical protein SWX82_31820 [Cyanobacteriota bacterium]|nr:hypothetical protein [Cyanobacteriota bacterium]
MDATQTDRQEDITVMEELHQEDREVLGLLGILATAEVQEILGVLEILTTAQDFHSSEN